MEEVSPSSTRVFKETEVQISVGMVPWKQFVEAAKDVRVLTANTEGGIVPVSWLSLRLMTTSCNCEVLI